jgi:hypothetical protein
MSSQNKKRKLKNSFSIKTWLKNKTIKLKRIGFYTSSNRKESKKIEE